MKYYAESDKSRKPPPPPNRTWNVSWGGWLGRQETQESKDQTAEWWEVMKARE